MTTSSEGQAESPATRPSAVSRAYEHLKEAVASGDLDEGAFISADEVARELGISRTPVREALMRLHAERMVEVLPKRGVYVRPIHPRETAEAFEARLLLELHGARSLVAAPGRARPLRALLDQQRKCADEGDGAGFIERDREFHLAIVEAAGNSQLSGFYETLRDAQLRSGRRALRRDPARMEDVLREHEAIVEAAEAESRERLEAAIREHLAQTLELLGGELPTPERRRAP